jgi:hypothetical protein
MIVPYKARVRMMTEILYYALFWSGTVVGIANKFPMFKFPAERKLQLNAEIAFEPYSAYDVTIDIGIEGERTVIHIDYRDGSPIDHASFVTPSIDFDFTFSDIEVASSLDLQFDFLKR